MDNTIPVACFAPPLTDEKIANYKLLINSQASSEVADAMVMCLKCVEAWWNLPESTRTDVKRWGILHKGQKSEFVETPLEEDHIKKLWDVTPWDRELSTLSNSTSTGLFDTLPYCDLKNAAFHLLWFAKEITRDREPLSVDKLDTI